MGTGRDRVFGDELIDTPVLITIVIFLLTHLGVAIWFASRVNTKVGLITESVKEMTGDIKQMAAMETRIAVLDSRMNRAEEDAREAIKAVALVASEKKL